VKFVFSLPDGATEEMDVVYYIGGRYKSEAGYLNGLLRQEPQPISYEAVVKLYDSSKAHAIRELKYARELQMDAPNSSTINAYQQMLMFGLQGDEDFAAISRVKDYLDSKRPKKAEALSSAVGDVPINKRGDGMSEKTCGTVKWFNEPKGFGFIESDDIHPPVSEPSFFKRTSDQSLSDHEKSVKADTKKYMALLRKTNELETIAKDESLDAKTRSEALKELLPMLAPFHQFEKQLAENLTMLQSRLEESMHEEKEHARAKSFK